MVSSGGYNGKDDSFTEVEKQRFFVVVPFVNSGIEKRSTEDFFAFMTRLKRDTTNVSVFVVECAFGSSPFLVTKPMNPQHIQIRSPQPMWLKEHLINLAVSKLPSSWKYVAWVDPGVEFGNPNWVREAIQTLKKYHLVQLFDKHHASSIADDKTPTEAVQSGFVRRQLELMLGSHLKPGESSPLAKSLLASSSESHTIADRRSSTTGHPGLAWAATQRAWELMGGLLDFAIGGAGDVYMAYGLLGMLESCSIELGPGEYKKAIEGWGKRAQSFIQKNIGYIRGSIHQRWQEPNSETLILAREKLLCESHFDPQKDLKKDFTGLYSFADPHSPLAIKLAESFALKPVL